ncbi:hypothetical protein Tco_0078959 [Tanacetum coccineum]
MVLILQFRAITLVVPLIPTFITSDDPLIASSSRIPAIPCQMADFLVVRALCSARAIMVKLALVAQWKSSSILLPFTSPSGLASQHRHGPSGLSNHLLVRLLLALYLIWKASRYPKSCREVHRHTSPPH